ncbi:MAG: patatin-like phospholipase family protein, partial [Sphaerochaetaceae bacterium]
MGRTVRRMMLVALLALVTALRLSSASIPNNTNDLMAAAVPISYGESLFRQRILVQTEGERDPVGLVLSGGSARAFAHIGVLQYLEEQGIVPDFIISNSMGSIVGILYAAGLSPDQILSIITEVDITQLFDLSIPLAGGVLDISRFLSLVASHLGESLRIEELPIPIMIVCEDLATKRQVRIMEGDMLTVMGAAFALPVYFPPVEYNGHMLVDGGITNLVPLDIAYRFTDTTIVSTTFYEGED